MMRKLLELLHTVLKLAQWIPFLGKWRAIILAVSAVLGSLLAIKCDSPTPDPAQKTKPTPTQTPTPTPSPKPTPPPLPELKAPKFVKVGESFQVQLCNTGNKYNVKLFADRWLLGHMGFGKPCMVLNVALNTAGERRLHIDSDTLQLETIVVVQ